MDKQLFSDKAAGTIDRVDGRAKVTGGAAYAADHKIQDTAFGFLVGSTIAKGRIKSIDTKAAERAPGVIAVITHLNAPKIPGYQTGKDPSKPQTTGQPLRVFFDNEIYFYDHPIALVIADTYERVLFASKLVKATYEKEQHQTDLANSVGNAKTPVGKQYADYQRGDADAYKTAPVKLDLEYYHPIEVHNPMEPGAIIAQWDGDDRITVFTKTQGVQSTQRTLRDAFKLPAENITVNAEHVGGAFGMALRTWPYEIAAVMGAKKIGKPLKLVLHREQMFTNVGYRPETIQKIGIGATEDGRLVGIAHEAIANTSSYEQFTEATVNITRFMYACPGVTTRYKIVPLNIGTPIWMRGPGEATGSFALESAMDELAYQLKIDPLEFRIRNHADTDPESNRPWSSKFLKECYELGADKIGWKNRKLEPRSLKNGDWLEGYGMGAGAFGAFRGAATVKATLRDDGSLTLECSVNDMGPGTATMMTSVAAESMKIPADRIRIVMGSTTLPPGPTQGGSTVTATVGSAVHDVCEALKEELKSLPQADTSGKTSYGELLKKNNLPLLEVTKESRGTQQPYASYSFSVHFVKVSVHPPTGTVRIDHVVSCADAGTIVNESTAASQMMGGAVGGIGMALMEELAFDHRFGRPVNNNLADYHVPVNADILRSDVLFVNKKDPYINPIGAKGLGEIALVGVAPAVANAIFNATGKRVRSLPITKDKLLESHV